MIMTMSRMTMSMLCLCHGYADVMKLLLIRMCISLPGHGMLLRRLILHQGNTHNNTPQLDLLDHTQLLSSRSVG